MERNERVLDSAAAGESGGLYVENGLIYNSRGEAIASLTDFAKDEDVKLLKLSLEAAPAITGFVERVNHGHFHKKKEYNIMLELIKKHR